MPSRGYAGQNCSIARTLEIVGERWTLLIVRDAFRGIARFDDFQQSLGIARNVLADRLGRLTDAGILERVPQPGRPDRPEYRLTPKGRDLRVALAALRQWGDEHLGHEAPTLLRRAADGTPVVAALVPEGAETVPVDEVESVPGPGARE
jgi:DNA-binding HxlR family transcriptional regulator